MPGSTEISANNATPTSSLNMRSGKLIPQTMNDESHASASLDRGSDQNFEDTASAFPFLKLPAELRNRIYRYLLHAHSDICIGELDVDSPEASKEILRRRVPDKECARSSKFRGEMTTYGVRAIGVHPGILSANWQTYLEASRIFYSENRFNFVSINPVRYFFTNDTIIPFLKDRSEGSRRLIKQVEYRYVLTEFGPQFYDPQCCAHLNHVFEETCNYLSQALQLEHVTLNFFALRTKEIYSCTAYKDYLLDLDKQNWVHHLVPLVENLDKFTLIPKYDDEDDLALVRAAQTYLESKMHKASKRARQTQNVQELAHNPAASEE